MSKKWVVFTDLDGTLLDYNTYSFLPAHKSLKFLDEQDIPLCMVTSKTRAEVEEFRKLLSNNAPFISENGGGVFVPQGYFPFSFDFDRIDSGYKVIELGMRHAILLKELVEAARATDVFIKPLSLLSKDELIELTDLSPHQVELMMDRAYDEPFIFEGGDMRRLVKKIGEKGLKITKGGRFFHVTGKSNKGAAVERLIELFRRLYPGIRTVALGDSENDLPMLKVADAAVIVKGCNGDYNGILYKEFYDSNKGADKKVLFSDGIGPYGWNSAILEILEGGGLD